MKNSLARRAAYVFFVLLGCCQDGGAEPPFAMDGNFDDWTGIAPSVVDPVGDSSGVFDVGQVYAVGRGSRLTLRFDIGTAVNLPAGPASDGTLRILIGLPSGEQLTIDLRGRRAFLASAPQTTIPWSNIAFRSGPTFASRQYEVEADLGAYGIGPESVVSLDFSGSDSLSAPLLVSFGPASDNVEHRSGTRPAGTRFRIASLNTLVNGLSPISPRTPAISRLLTSANADVVALQEEYSVSQEFIGLALAQTATPPDTLPWNVLKVDDCVIGSRWPLVAIPSPGFRSVSAVVQLPTGPVALFSVHLSCCGYVGSGEDLGRITQMQGIAQTVLDLRAGVLGPALKPYANSPVIITGDWNLVGSRTPLDVAEGVGVSAEVIRHLASGDAFTWRDDPTRFWPGRLDLLAFSRRNLLLARGHVLDTAELTSEELAKMGLQASDSAASDHLLTVADFVDRCPADFTPDGTVNSQDFFDFLTAFFAFGPDADFNHDTFINSQDVFDFLAAFFAGC
ncbi:MAG: endonuclease/exonuclease/phosphatase family protein [Pyrinomonadaceae bacterium]|nr:endonuclease/exonuclease/phosphatase family protein [Phycisphaerales bacterium]